MATEIDIHIRSIKGSDISAEELNRLLDRVCRTALEHEGWTRAEVSVLITDDEEIRELNRTYRGIDEATDVLSFPLLSPEDDAVEFDDEDLVPPLGDIVISLDHAVAQAREYGHTPEREIAFLLVHGVLHLLGYDHDEEKARRTMRAKEEAILTALELPR